MAYSVLSLYGIVSASTFLSWFAVCLSVQKQCYVLKVTHNPPPDQKESRKPERDQFSLEVGHTKGVRRDSRLQMKSRGIRY